VNTVDPGLTTTLADYAARLQFSDLPAEVAHEAKRALVDHVGVALAAADDPAVAALMRVSDRLVGTGPYTVIGHSETASMPYAALINGFAAHLLD
jgi:2-methylcitrate dehydratase PrpD